jgi:hypothetical protein
LPKPTKKQDVRPYWLINYRHNNTNYWDTIGEDQMEGYLDQLLKKGVNPATIFISMLFQHNWLFPSRHNGLRMINPTTFYEELEGIGNKATYTPVDVPAKKEKKVKSYYGFISPDGRHFHCEYGDHSALAREIVGHLEEIKDAQKYLEKQNWVVIYNDPIKHKTSMYLPYNQKVTDAQLKTIEKLPITIDNLSEYL